MPDATRVFFNNSFVAGGIVLRFRTGARDLVFPETSGPTVGPTQPPVPRGTGGSFPRVRAAVSYKPPVSDIST